MTTPKLNRSIQSQSQHINELAMPAAERDGALFNSLSRRTFNAMTEVTKRVGLATAIMTGGAGIVLPEQQADAGIVVDLQYDPQARANGEGYAIENGGNVGYIDTDLGYASGVAWNQNGHGWLITPTHVVLGGGSLNFGTGTNFNSNPGTLYSPADVFLHPLHVNGRNGIDLALIRLNSEVAGAGELVFADSRPAEFSEVWLAGYGLAGTRAGYTTQDGFIRAGTSDLLYGDVVGDDGFSPNYYGLANMQTFFGPTTTLRAADGDSGGGVFGPNGELIGLISAGSTSAFGTRTFFVDTTAPEVRSFIDFHITAVPEPSSFLPLAGAGLTGIAFRRSRKTPVYDHS